mmetsp:Transcript_10833/g.21768  ORF Transcript_10833/g.21768 Transcript_10833/m.21768 type:complete len:497 (+) Transcript_10833:237-1727(+)|eukprot:CAMPEP_0181331378 /NCGR_PEP_ID=MMETSP1101-20121128/24463_1 /TAXON_ID=46948 /ORGANISM="Rhodomonas abbreviata, Strain Caron Lab Isolate" /LENGTH=496 /DNA_ID=CAMNT_0023440821 /DNA_START=227 /DNA_END=1714 /DNA_ORIENTATION=-
MSVGGTKRSRLANVSSNAIYSADEWEIPRSAVAPSSKQGVAVPRQQRRFHREASNVSMESLGSSSDSESLSSSPTPSGRGGGKKKEERMGGLALPEVVRELLKDSSVLRWDSRESVYEVLHGDNFEKRFNELRKVRNKVKASGTERPFSRMYNFFVLEQGDKWARTGTRFRPRTTVGYPSPEFLASLKSIDGKKSSTLNASAKARASSASIWSSSSKGSSSTPVKNANISESSPRVSSTQAAFSSRAQLQRTAVTGAALNRALKPVSKARKLSSSASPSSSFSLPNASDLGGGLEVGAIAHSLLGKRAREFHLTAQEMEQVLPRDLIEVTARRLRVLDREDTRDYYPVRHDAPEMHGEAVSSTVGRVSFQHVADAHADEVHDEFQEEHEAETSEQPPSVPAYGAEMRPEYTTSGTDYDSCDPSDGFSSGVPSPESVMSLVGDFPGSPLNLEDEEHGHEDQLSALICSPSHPTLSKDGFYFDALEESAWVSDTFAAW